MPGWMLALIFSAIPLVFIVIWVGVAFGCAHIGGWSTLAREFRSDKAPPSSRFRVQRLSVGAANYSGAVSLSPQSEGVWISISPLFRFAHPTLWVPWRAVSGVEERPGFAGSRYFNFTVQTRGAPVKITFYDARLAKALGAARETHGGNR